MQMDCESRKIGDRSGCSVNTCKALKSLSRVDAERGFVRDRKISCELVEVSAGETV